MEFIETTLCYIEKDDCYLMLLRNKEKDDINHNKWLGIGGHIEINETPEECMIREANEETGLSLLNINKRGTIYFHSGDLHEKMHLFTCNSFVGNLIECDEGTLKWIPIKEVPNLNLWEGDKVFLKELVSNDNYFEMSFYYDGDILKKVEKHQI